MKHLRQMLVLLITMMMSVTLGAPAYADVDNNTGVANNTIKVDGLQAGDSINYYQVIQWNATTGWELTEQFKTLNQDVYNAVVGTPAIQGKIEDGSATAIAALAKTPDGTGSVTGTYWEQNELDPGLYMVQAVPTTADVIYNPVFVAVNADGTGHVVRLPLSYDNNGTAKKSDVTVNKFAKSAGEADSAYSEYTTEDVGDIIDYKIETTIPAYLESYTNPEFIVTDRLSDGLTFVLNTIDNNPVYTTITVKDENGTLTKDTDYTLDELGSYNWKISFTKAYLTRRVNATVATITYQAKITDDAKNVNPETNTVNIEYSRNPNIENDHGTKEDKTNHYTFDIDAGLQGDAEYITSEIIKVAVDEDGNPILVEKEYNNKEKHNPLQGAVFELFTDLACTTHYNNSNYDDNTTFLTDEWGRMEIKGLDEGTYYLKETSPVNGYMLLTDPIKFNITAHFDDNKELDYYEVFVNDKVTSHYTIDNGTVIKNDKSTAGDVGYEIENTKGVSLPSTGGIGTTIFYIVGGIMVAGAVVFLLTKRRLAGNE